MYGVNIKMDKGNIKKLSKKKKTGLSNFSPILLKMETPKKYGEQLFLRGKCTEKNYILNRNRT